MRRFTENRPSNIVFRSPGSWRVRTQCVCLLIGVISGLSLLFSSRVTWGWSTEDASAAINHLAVDIDNDAALYSLEAESYASGVEVHWSSGRGPSVGFHVSRETGSGVRHRITPRLIAGAAFSP